MLAKMIAQKLRNGLVAASLGVFALAFCYSAPAWSQVSGSFALESSISDRFESGEFGAPLGEIRQQPKMQAALKNTPQPQYVYYVVPCDTPGAIRAGSPSTLDPSRLDTAQGEDTSRDENVCIALVDENLTDSAPLLYTYDSSYRYPKGYPNHHLSGSYSGGYASSINAGYSSTRLYGALRYGYRHYGHFPFGMRRYGGFPYAVGPYGYSYGSYSGNPYGPFPYGAYPYSSPYVSYHYGFGFSVAHYGRRHYGSHHFLIPHSRLGH